MAPRSWFTRTRSSTFPFPSQTAKTEYLLCASHPTL